MALITLSNRMLFSLITMVLSLRRTKLSMADSASATSKSRAMGELMILWIVFWKSLLAYWLAAASESLSVDQFRHLRVPHQPAYKRARPHVVNPVHLQRFSLILLPLDKPSNIFRLQVPSVVRLHR